MPGPRLPVTAVANGIAPAPLPRRKGKGAAPVILCVGRFTAQKLHCTLLLALARLHKAGLPARLQLVGSGPLQPRLEGLADG